MRLFPVLFSLLLLGPLLSAQDLGDIGSVGESVTITLANGDVVSGTIVENTGTQVILSNTYFGDMTIPRTIIVLPEPPADEVFVETPWGGSADFALDGNSGNTNNTTLHGEINLRQETEGAVDTILVTADVRRDQISKPAPSKTSRRTTTDQRHYVRFRRDWKLLESRWRPFFEVSADHNFQKDYTELFTVGGGAGYAFRDDADETLIGRVGLAEAQRYGATRASDEHWTLEGLVGLDYRLNITERQHFAAETTIFPSLADTGEFRTVSKAEWRLDLSDDSPWYYKIGLTHNFDSQVSAPTKQSDVSYHMGVGTVF